MIAKNCTMEDMLTALVMVNRKYEGNILFRHLDHSGKRLSFTLKVKDSKAPGHGRGHSGNRTASCCWHVHGHFFEELFNVRPEAVVYSSRTGKWITKDGGNWEDYQVGSMMSPKRASQACDCGMLRPTMEGDGWKTYAMARGMVGRCPHFILAPEHYKADGTCLCFDKGHQDKLQAERAARRAQVIKHARQ
jgi:hypothetical protein